MQNKNEKFQVVIVALITAFCLLGDSMLYIVLPTHWQEVGLGSLWEVGVLLSANRFIRVPLNPIVSRIYKKISHRNGILLAVTLSVIATASYGLNGFWLLLFMRCVWGVAWTFLRLGAYFFIINLSGEDNRGHYMGTYNGLFRLGSLVGMLLGGILADLFGIKAVALLFAGITFLAFLLVLIFLNTSSVEMVPSSVSSTPVSLWSNPNLIWMLLTGFFVTMFYQGAFTSTLSHLINLRQSQVSLFNILIGSASLAGILQALRWGWEPWLAPWFGKKSDKWGRQPLLVISLIVAAILFASINLNLSFWGLLIILLGIQLTATILTTVVDTIAGDIATQTTSKASVMTTYSIITDLGSALGAVVSYLIASFIDIQTLYWSIAVILLVLSFRWLIIGRIKIA